MIRFLSKEKKSNLSGVAIVRLDFNSSDAWRVESALPTIRFLLDRGARVVMMGHRGRPENVSFVRGAPKDKKLSLKKDAAMLKRLLRRRVVFIPHFRFREIKQAIKASTGTLFLLENLRFLKGEGKNDPKLGKDLASLADFYVNDAFAVSHRAAASTVGITKFLPHYAGFGLERELFHLNHVMENPKKPLLMIFGGAKAREKLRIMERFRKKASAFIVAGALSNTIIRGNGVGIGDSTFDKIPMEEARKFIRYLNLFLPLDYVVSENKIVDIGPKTVRFIAAKVCAARTIIWNGPLGITEEQKFAKGTLALVRAIAANRRAFSLAGGGETVMFLRKYKLDKKFTFISTGGGAMLDFLAGKKLPGIEALER